MGRDSIPYFLLPHFLVYSFTLMNVGAVTEA
jgi:hypothetical protein